VGAGFGATKNTSFIYTIWDGGGQDTLDASGYDDHVILDLRQGMFSSIGKAVDAGYNGGPRNDGFGVSGLAEDNVAIALHTVIENAVGTNDIERGDIIVGNR